MTMIKQQTDPKPHLILLKLQMHLKSLFSQLLIFASGLAIGFSLSLFHFPADLLQISPTLSAAATTTATLLPPPPPRVGLPDLFDPPPAMHDMSDEELLWRASLAPRIVPKLFPSSPSSKIAFLFLTKDGVALAPLWELFFKGHHHTLFSIYVHSNSNNSNSTLSSSSVFYRRTIPSKGVKWGEPSMMEAERRLLANALLDFSNQRFVLLSESCIPLFNFSTVYNYLMGSKSTFIEAYDLPGPVGRGRYRPKMRPTVNLHQWRKGSQWFQLDRPAAAEVVSDHKFFPIFQKHCRPPCYMDEHYLPTLAAIRFSGHNSNRTLTWVDWSRGGPHPTRFIRNDVTVALLQRLRTGAHCQYNGVKTNVCHLFARKFMPNSLNRLLMFAPKLMRFNH